MQEIINNFKDYNRFLKHNNKKVFLSLKMMYSVHMQNIKKNTIFYIKQIIRYLVKFALIPFYKYKITNLKKDIAILDNTDIEKYIAQKVDCDLIKIAISPCLNKKFFKVYKEVIKNTYILIKSPLKKAHLIPILHRLIDYIMLFETLDTKNLKILLIENDRIPTNLALIHLLQKNKKISIKYDNWLIDPINHNDVYCDYYYYPNNYHKEIIKSQNINKNTKYIKGGFLHWDKLSNYSLKPHPKTKIIYFTQFNIDINEHLQYINDILEISKQLFNSFELIIKIHPRETNRYEFIKNKNIKVIKSCDNIYELIANSDYCFSVFSTISLEAKHIIKHSYFINYNKNFSLIDYKKIGLDVINSKNLLLKVLKNEFNPISQENFINQFNCNFPYSIQKLKNFINNLYHKNFS